MQLGITFYPAPMPDKNASGQCRWILADTCSGIINFGNQCFASGTLRGGNTAVIQLYVVTEREGTSAIWVVFISHLDRLCDLPVVAILTSQ